ncbi:MAG: BlaI/MecI/CopY family transcriptional regulator [Planctomycetota bacterium]
MARPASRILTEREAQIMDALWALGSATAEKVREALPDEPHDSTVRTHLRVLESKGYVGRSKQGKAHVYRPAVPRSKAQGTAIRSLVTRLFEGSPEALIVRLLEDEEISVEKIDELRRARVYRDRGENEGDEA